MEINFKRLINEDPNFELNGLEDPLVNDETRYIVKVLYKPENIRSVLKIPLDDRGTRKCEKEYDIQTRIADNSHFVRLIGKKPFKIGDYSAVLMHEAEMNFSRFIKNETHTDKHLEKAFKDHAMGISQLHNINITHKDIKPSNFLYYSNGDVWVVTDTSLVSEKEGSNSHATREHFASPELSLKKSYGESEKNIYWIMDDIFKLGITFYMALTKQTSRGFYGDKDGIPATELKKKYQMIFDKVGSLKSSEDMKYLLKKLVGPEDKANLPDGYSEFTRYQSLNDFLTDIDNNPIEIRRQEELEKKRLAEEKQKQAELERIRLEEEKIRQQQKETEIYNQFSSICDVFNRNLIDGKKSRNEHLGTIIHEGIEGIVTSFNNVKTSYADKDKEVASLKDASTKYQTIEEQYAGIRKEEYGIIVKKITEIEKQNGGTNVKAESLTSKVLIELAEKAYLWGGVPFVPKSMGDYRCSLADIYERKAPCHNPDYLKKK